MSEAKRFDDLPARTKDFLSNLRPEEIDTLNDGIRLVSAIRTVGTFMKWVIVGLIGILAGFVMIGESISKIASWMKRG
ncbi:hypothetical protein [Nitrobacter sp. TKz-YC01]|uniref:hypothetical protein n=1 Tax=Nitrobacter sp. TKz-YC01 TaxID=3398703 RepID=UPI003A1030B9